MYFAGLHHLKRSENIKRKIIDQIMFATPKPKVSRTVHVSEGSTLLLINGVLVYHSATIKLRNAFRPTHISHVVI